jgi:hypothetical protein
LRKEVIRRNPEAKGYYKNKRIPSLMEDLKKQHLSDDDFSLAKSVLLYIFKEAAGD